ncbi:MAG: hypothetical protein Q4B71_04480 [Cardiobacteriaceae bacterium]|nr:hypothetical protein [Cardiobacteriaceae bacterium]
MRLLPLLLACISLLGCSSSSIEQSPQPKVFQLSERAQQLVQTLMQSPHKLMPDIHAPRCQKNSQHVDDCLRAGINTAHHDLNRLLFGSQQTLQSQSAWQLKTAKIDYSDLNHAKALIYAKHTDLDTISAIRINLIYIDQRWKLDLSHYINSLQDPSP